MKSHSKSKINDKFNVAAIKKQNDVKKKKTFKNDDVLQPLCLNTYLFYRRVQIIK